jgi:hypothetical protein
MTFRIKVFVLISLLAGYIFHVSQNPVDIMSLGPGESGYCIPASVSKVLKFWKINVSVKEIEKRMSNLKDVNGVYKKGQYQIGAIPEALEGLGLKVVFRVGNLEEIETLLEKRIPPLIHCYLDNVTHVWILTGYRTFPGYYSFSDSDSRSYAILSRSRLLNVWDQQNFEYLVIAPPEKIPDWCVNNSAFYSARGKASLLYSAFLDGASSKSREEILSIFQLLKKEMETDQPGYELYNNLISCYGASMGENDEQLIFALEKLLKVKRNYERFLFFLAKLKIESGQHEKGKMDLESYIKMRPTDESAARYLASYTKM